MKLEIMYLYDKIILGKYNLSTKLINFVDDFIMIIYILNMERSFFIVVKKYGNLHCKHALNVLYLIVKCLSKYLNN